MECQSRLRATGPQLWEREIIIFSFFPPLTGRNRCDNGIWNCSTFPRNEDLGGGGVYVEVGVSASFCVWVSFERVWNDCCCGSSPESRIKRMKRYSASQPGWRTAEEDWSVTDSVKHIGAQHLGIVFKVARCLQTELARGFQCIVYSGVNSSWQWCSESSKCHISATYFRVLKEPRMRQIRVSIYFLPIIFSPSLFICWNALAISLFSFPFSCNVQIQSSIFSHSPSAWSLNTSLENWKKYLFPLMTAGLWCETVSI